jgi:hypothetical protein
MTTIIKYRLWCTTDSKYEYVLREDDTEPTMCPTDTAHAINKSRTSVYRTYEFNKVKIQEEVIDTGGNFCATTLNITATKNNISSGEILFPFPISALAVEFVAEEIHRGDTVNLIVGENTPIGVILVSVTASTPSSWTAQNYTAGQMATVNGKLYTCIADTVSNEDPSNLTFWHIGLEITASHTVIDNTAIGYYLKLSDGTNFNELSRVVGVDKIFNKIYVEDNVTNSFANTTPTYVLQSVKSIHNHLIGGPGGYIIGSNKIGGSYVPANTPVRIYYDNKSTDTDKLFIGKVEYLY